MQDISTRPTALKYALVYAGIMIVYSVMTYSMDLVANTFWGFLSYAISIGVIGMALVEYKKLNEGYLSIKQGIGLAIVLRVVGELIAGAFNYIYFTFINKEGMTTLLESVEKQLSETEGMTPEMMDMMMGMYEKMFQPVPMLFLGLVFAVLGGLVFGLILSAIMKNERPMMDYEE